MNRDEAITKHAADCASQRAKWGAGPWTNEPDRVEWTTRAGLPAIALRQPRSGHWCGYVGVAPGHRWHGVDLQSYPEGVEVPDAHGGITYNEHCVGAVCHVPQPGEPDDLWWIGFDCAHAGDRTPGSGTNIARIFLDDEADARFGGVYRTIDFVQKQCERLAKQAVRT